jgi:hypothetical protein
MAGSILPVFAAGCHSLRKDDIRVWASLTKVILAVYSFSKCAKVRKYACKAKQGNILPVVA